MSKALIALKKAQIEKELAIAKTTAKHDAEVKLTKLWSDLQYSQADIDEIEERYKSEIKSYQYWVPRHYGWILVAACAITAIVVAMVCTLK